MAVDPKKLEEVTRKWIGYEVGSYKVVGYRHIKGTICGFKLVLRCEKCGVEIERHGRWLKFLGRKALKCICTRVKSQLFEEEIAKVTALPANYDENEVKELTVVSFNRALKIMREKDPPHRYEHGKELKKVKLFIGDQPFTLTAYSRVVRVPSHELLLLLERKYPLKESVEFLKSIWFEKQEGRWQLRDSVNPDVKRDGTKSYSKTVIPNFKEMYSKKKQKDGVTKKKREIE